MNNGMSGMKLKYYAFLGAFVNILSEGQSDQLATSAEAELL